MTRKISIIGRVLYSLLYSVTEVEKRLEKRPPLLYWFFTVARPPIKILQNHGASGACRGTRLDMTRVSRHTPRVRPARVVWCHGCPRTGVDPAGVKHGMVSHVAHVPFRRHRALQPERPDPTRARAPAMRSPRSIVSPSTSYSVHPPPCLLRATGPSVLDSTTPRHIAFRLISSYVLLRTVTVLENW